jgi:SynChlorMet cassette radical SAM/SPASM protein ScmF
MPDTQIEPPTVTKTQERECCAGTSPEVPPLSRLYFYLTEGCNLACRHCWIAPEYDPQVSRRPVMAVETFALALKEAKPLGLSGAKLTGGEPLLHPRFSELLDVLEREEITPSVETNGVLMTGPVAQRLATMGAAVAVSLDAADPEMHDHIRGVRGAFEGATRAIALLVEAGADIQVICTVMRVNADQIDDVVDLAGEMGAASVKLNVLQPSARGEALHASDQALPVAEYIRLGNAVDAQYPAPGKPVVDFHYPPAFRPLSRIARDPGAGRCGIQGVVGVLAGGKYALCGIGAHVSELAFGAVQPGALEQIWSHEPVITALREGLPDRLEGICGDCAHNGMCLGACVAQNYYRARDLFAPFWFCAEADRAGFFPPSRRRSGDLRPRHPQSSDHPRWEAHAAGTAVQPHECR